MNVIQWFSAYLVVLLGDILESLALEENEIALYDHSSRLLPMRQELGKRAVLLVPGNHDKRAVAHLRHWLGEGRIRRGGFRIGKVLFTHGHEHDVDDSHWVEGGAWLVRFGGALDRLGLPSAFGTIPNAELAAPYVARGAFPILGHTHVAAITPQYANSGCFLRNEQTCLTLADATLRLWRAY